MNRLKAHSSRVTRGLLLFVAITLTLNSTFGLVAHADAATFLTAENNKHYAAIYLRDCLAGLGNSKASILQSKAADPASIFVALGKSTPEVNIGQVYKSGDGKLSCSDGGAIGTALSTFGTASGEDFLKSIGYTLGSARSIVCKDMNTVPPSNCTDVNVPAYTISGGDTMNSKIPSQSSAARFYAYQNIFNSNCSVTEAASGAYTQTQVIKDPAGSSYITKDVKVDFPSTTSTNRYQSSGSVTISSAGKAIVNLDFNSGDTTCKGLLETMNGLAPAVARYNDANPGNAVTTNASTGAGGNTAVNGSGGTKTCAIEGTGWMVCTVGGAIASAADMMFSVIAKMMELPAVSTAQDKGMYPAWEVFRNIANVAFIIAFLIMVYSQITGAGGNGR